MTFAVALFANTKDNQPRQGACSWESLVRHLTQHRERETKDGPLWSPTLYRQGTPRGKANVLAVSCLVLDFDSGQPAAEFSRGWSSLAYIMHTTFQHTEQQERWRVVFPLAAPVSGDEWPFAWLRMTEHFGGNAIDGSCKDASRIYFLPACLPDAPRAAVSNDGSLLDPAEFLRPNREFLIDRAKGELHSGRNNAGMWLACQMRDNQYTQTETEDLRWHQVVPREKTTPGGSVNLYTEEEWRETVRKAFGRPAREAWKSPKNGTNGVHAEPNGQAQKANLVVKVVGRNSTESPQALEAESLYGLPGLVVRILDPHTESHQAAILTSFLIGAGCLFGGGPHIYRDGGRLTANNFACLVGPSATGRKGTATRRTDEIFKCLYDSKYNNLAFMNMHARGPAVASSWEEFLLSGLGSGEAMIEALADETADRRRLIFEEEFSKPLKIMRRENSVLSETLRCAWDGAVLANITKGKTIRAKNAHISILGHITDSELAEEMKATSVFNGFSNRFLWIWVNRSKSLPFGGGKAPIAPIVSHLHEALHFAAQLGEMEFDDEVKALWDGGGLYDLLRQRPPGLLGAATSRADAHVTRLALEWALLDLSREVQVPHLLAALAFWDYAERTAAYLFGTSTGNDAADLIIEVLREAYPEGLNRKAIRDLFQRNAPPGKIPAALSLLSRLGMAERFEQDPEGRGRPAELWRAVAITTYDLNDLNPLRKARELLKERAS